MTLYKYEIKFKNGDRINFNSEVDIDFHSFKPDYLAFNDLFVNFSEVNYIKKEIVLVDV